MENLDQLKQKWAHALAHLGPFDEASMRKLVKSRINKHTRQAYNYFWASFVMQILMYAMLCHVTIRFWNNPSIVAPAIGGMLLFIPFTVVLMKKFKAMAVTPLGGTESSSVLSYVQEQRNQLASILQFKIRYELVLIPLINAVGVAVPIGMYMQGGLMGNLGLATGLYFLSLVVCYFANRSENQKSFIAPMKRLDGVLEEYQTNK